MLLWLSAQTPTLQVVNPLMPSSQACGSLTLVVGWAGWTLVALYLKPLYGWVGERGGQEIKAPVAMSKSPTSVKPPLSL